MFRKIVSIQLALLLGVLLVVGCSQVHEEASSPTDYSIIVDGNEINVKMTHEQIREILGQPEKTTDGYFFNESISTDYYDGENVLVRYTNQEFNGMPVDELLSILVLGGSSKAQGEIIVGNSMDTVYSVFGEKEFSGYRSSDLYYTDYESSSENYDGIAFYYDPADNVIIRYTLHGSNGWFD